jgi:hypothetical protein
MGNKVAANASDAKIQILERGLLLTNRGQGLGFVAGGRVLDLRTLQVVFAGVVSLLSTVLPILIAMRPAIGGDEVCGVTANEIELVRATFTNRSCSYANVTIGSLLEA